MDPDQKLIMTSMGQAPKPHVEFPPKSPDKLLNYVGSQLKPSQR